MQNFCRINNHKNNFESTNFYYLQFNSTWVRKKNFNKHPEGKVDSINKNKTVSVKTCSLIHYTRKEPGIPIICIAWTRGMKEYKRNSCILHFYCVKYGPISCTISNPTHFFMHSIIYVQFNSTENPTMCRRCYQSQIYTKIAHLQLSTKQCCIILYFSWKLWNPQHISIVCFVKSIPAKTFVIRDKRDNIQCHNLPSFDKVTSETWHKW